MQPLRVKFGKNCQWTKRSKTTLVDGWGKHTSPKSAKENKNSLNMSTVCLCLHGNVHEHQEKTLHIPSRLSSIKLMKETDVSVQTYSRFSPVM